MNTKKSSQTWIAFDLRWCFTGWSLQARRGGHDGGGTSSWSGDKKNPRLPGLLQRNQQFPAPCDSFKERADCTWCSWCWQPVPSHVQVSTPTKCALGGVHPLKIYKSQSRKHVPWGIHFIPNDCLGQGGGQGVPPSFVLFFYCRCSQKGHSW